MLIVARAVWRNCFDCLVCTLFDTAEVVGSVDRKRFLGVKDLAVWVLGWLWLKFAVSGVDFTEFSQSVGNTHLAIAR